MKVFGVNYGSIFVPEDWMFKEDIAEFYRDCKSFCKDANNEDRLCLACLPSDEFEARYLSWLDKHIKDDDFATMAAMGVTVLRVPCGYWNWVTFPHGSTPDGAHANHMKVLETVKPHKYRPYFDRVFTSAKNHGIKILLDLHALPGSQNGEMHSGFAVEKAQFDTEWNKKKAVEAVGEMAKYCRNWLGGTLYGIQVINEPNHYGHNPHEYLDKYYDESIRSAREHLPFDIPIIVFEWTYYFDKWSNDRFDYKTYGNVIWDTHVYHTNVNGDVSLESQQNQYWNDLGKIESFHKKQSGGCIVGEWSLAGPSWSKEKNQEFAQWIVWCFMERCHGCFFWNFDADISEWSFKKCNTNFQIDWKAIPKPE